MYQVEIPVNNNSFKDIVLTASAGLYKRGIIYKGEIPNENDTQ